jgi:hypothetical protein
MSSPPSWGMYSVAVGTMNNKSEGCERKAVGRVGSEFPAHLGKLIGLIKLCIVYLVKKTKETLCPA